METNKTLGIAIDANYGCIFALVGGFLSGSLAIATLVSVLLATGPVGWLVGAILVGSYIAFGVSLGGIIFSCWGDIMLITKKIRTIFLIAGEVLFSYTVFYLLYFFEIYNKITFLYLSIIILFFIIVLPIFYIIDNKNKHLPQ